MIGSSLRIVAVTLGLLMAGVGCNRGASRDEAAQAKADRLEREEAARAAEHAKSVKELEARTEKDRLEQEKNREAQVAAAAAKAEQAKIDQAERARVQEQKAVKAFRLAQANEADAEKRKVDFLKSRLKSPFPPDRPNERAFADNPKSFEDEAELTRKHLVALETAESMKECRSQQMEYERKLLDIRRARFRPELAAHEADILKRLGAADPDGYFVVALEPPYSKWDELATGLAVLIDIFTLPLSIPADQPFAMSMTLNEHRAKIRVFAVRGKAATAGQIAQSVFAQNKLSVESKVIADIEKPCPWRLVSVHATEADAKAAVEKEAASIKAKKNDPREVLQIIVSPAK